MSKWVDSLIKHLQETPKDVLRQEWDEIKESAPGMLDVHVIDILDFIDIQIVNKQKQIIKVDYDEIWDEFSEMTKSMFMKAMKKVDESIG